MLIFLLSLVCLLGAVTAFLVWAFWPVIFQDYRAEAAKAETQARAYFEKMESESRGLLAELDAKAGLTTKPKA